MIALYILFAGLVLFAAHAVNDAWNERRVAKRHQRENDDQHEKLHTMLTARDSKVMESWKEIIGQRDERLAEFEERLGRVELYYTRVIAGETVVAAHEGRN